MKSRYAHLSLRFALVAAVISLFPCPAMAADGNAGGKRYALLIGVNDYADSSIVKLKTPRNDAYDIGRSLVAAGWDKVIVLTDDVDYRNPDFPNRTNIENRVSLLADLVNAQDTIFVFFSGHGVTSGKESLLLPVDAALSRVGDTSISLTSIVNAFSSKGLGRLVVAVDACREQVSTAKGLSVVGVAGGEGDFGANAAAITMYATKSGWYSYEDDNGRNGVFTKFILDGLAGGADGSISGDNANGIVTFAELAAWLPSATATYALDRGIRQQAMISKGSGDRSTLDVPVATTSAIVAPQRAANAPAAPSSTPTPVSGADDLKPALDSLKAHITMVIADSIKEIDKSIGNDTEDPPDAPDPVESVASNESDDESDQYGFSILQISLFAPLQLCPSDYTIGGIAVGAIQTHNDEVFGIQAAGIVASTNTMGGLQTALICVSDKVYGSQCGILVNTAADVYGGQFGFINTAASVYGVQMGFINTAAELHGVQLGFINTLSKSGLFGKFMFGLNIGW